MCVGADDGDGCDAEKRVTLYSAVSAAPPSSRPSSSVLVGGKMAHSSLNLDSFLEGSPGGAEKIDGGVVRGVCEHLSSSQHPHLSHHHDTVMA